MPLAHLDDDYMVWRVFRRVTFWMADEKGRPVRCRVEHGTLEDYAKRLCAEGAEISSLFEANRALIEQL